MSCTHISIGMATVPFVVVAEAMSAPLGPEFTYQGQLIDAGTPANEEFDLFFGLWADPTDTGPSQLIGKASGGD